MPIPSVGIDTRDIVDPGMINIEEQAYPRAVNDVLSQTFRTPVEVDVADLGLPQLPVLSPGSGSQAVGAEVEVDVAAQNVIRQPVAEFIVTDCGNFQTNAGRPDVVRRTIRANNPPGSPAVVTTTVDGQTRYQCFFVAGTNLFEFGVDLVGTEALFPNSAPALAPEDVPAAPILAFSTNWILVDGTDLSSAPVAANVVDLDVGREGFEPVFDQVAPAVDVNISTSTSPVQQDPVDFELFGRVVTVLAGTVGTPPIVPGGLQALPRVGEVTFVERVGVPVGENAPSSPPVIDVFK